MRTQVITTPSGETVVVLSEAEDRALVEAAEDTADRAAIAEFRRRLAAGEEEVIPDEVVGRLLSGESRIRVWREHRGLSVAALAELAGLSQATLSQVEAGKRDGTVEIDRAIAGALNLTLDDLLG
ncbi:helix-turn-helix domain-containing protein [Methylobacterium sp. JK268]